MSPAQLLTHFERISEAPGAVPRLRRFVLDLAVRGKLVEQDPRDEPASELLKRIQTGPINARDARKRTRTLSPATANNDVPYVVPSNWIWVTLSDICLLENGDRSKNYPSRDEFVAHGVPFINAGHLQSGSVSMASMNYIGRQRFDMLKSGKVKEGDLLFCLRGSLGKVALVGRVDAGAIASSLVIVRLFGGPSVRFVLNYFASSLAREMIERFDNGTAQPNLSSADLAKFLVPLPPISEQHRLVAKVDELMAMCERLEAAQAKRERRRDRLAGASLSRLNETTSASVSREHVSFHLNHLPWLTTRRDHIKQLRLAVLNLGMLGRLTIQDAMEEPAKLCWRRLALRNSILEEVQQKRGNTQARRLRRLCLWGGLARRCDQSSKSSPTATICHLPDRLMALRS
jgi:type I restriction enzyme S subunit